MCRNDLLCVTTIFFDDLAIALQFFMAIGGTAAEVDSQRGGTGQKKNEVYFEFAVYRYGVRSLERRSQVAPKARRVWRSCGRRERMLFGPAAACRWCMNLSLGSGGLLSSAVPSLAWAESQSPACAVKCAAAYRDESLPVRCGCPSALGPCGKLAQADASRSLTAAARAPCFCNIRNDFAAIESVASGVGSACAATLHVKLVWHAGLGIVAIWSIATLSVWLLPQVRPQLVPQTPAVKQTSLLLLRSAIYLSIYLSFAVAHPQSSSQCVLPTAMRGLSALSFHAAPSRSHAAARTPQGANRPLSTATTSSSAICGGGRCLLRLVACPRCVAEPSAPPAADGGRVRPAHRAYDHSMVNAARRETPKRVSIERPRRETPPTWPERPLSACF